MADDGQTHEARFPCRGGRREARDLP